MEMIDLERKHEQDPTWASVHDDERLLVWKSWFLGAARGDFKPNGYKSPVCTACGGDNHERHGLWNQKL